MSTTHWPAHTFEWFAELERNNNAEWFANQKERYAEIEQATTRFLESIGTHDGSIKVFRLRRDARFARGQPPLKTEQRGGHMAHDGLVRWIDLSAEGIRASVGHPMWDRGQLARARNALIRPDLAASLHRAIATATLAGLELDEPELKKPLRDLDPEHPHPDLTRHKHLALGTRLPAGTWLSKPGAFDRVATSWTAAGDVAAWLAEHVGPPDERPNAR